MSQAVGDKSSDNARTVIFGANGFIGQRVQKTLVCSGNHVLGLTSSDLNLLTATSEDVRAVLRDDDCVVFLSALTPERGNDEESLNKNIRMAASFIDAACERRLRHIVYVSTDGVYPFDAGTVTENTVVGAYDAYTHAHLRREKMFADAFSSILCIVRPTQTYGSRDPHMSYGPCRFMRDACAEGRITLFGNGEEMRDHISVYDVASLICYLQDYRHHGVFNLATGVSRSFRDVAEAVADAVGGVHISCAPRVRSVTHRSFDITKIQTIFPDYLFRDFGQEVSRMVHEG